VANNFTLDTNVLIYAIDSSQGSKHKLATKLLLRAAIMRQPLMLQSLNEFAAVVTRKRLVSASQVIKILRFHEKSFSLIPPNSEDLFVAVHAQQAHNLSFFDALFWATSKRAGCRLLLTEDFQDGRSLEGVHFVNPFKLSLRELKTLTANI
jgi:predicted nucleic acid-binding protein